MFRFVTAALLAALLVVTVQAANIVTVPVGNLGNTGEQSRLSDYDDTTYYGAVGDAYRIGKYEVTAGQYTEFLNKVAGVDTYALYNTLMSSDDSGCQIERFAGAGTQEDPYKYSVAADLAKRPVNYVSWGDAARFSNWLHNNQPSGVQGDGTTEDGAYLLDGATESSDLLAKTRKSDATWFIPTENEWYKAAYHKNDGVAANYFNYPTASDVEPDGIDSGEANEEFDAVFYDDDGYFQITPNNVNNTGEPSPYGTMGQGGNVWEWTETTVGSSYVLRGGGWKSALNNLAASSRSEDGNPVGEFPGMGFRVASIPEPGSIALLVCGLLTVMVRVRRRK